MRRQSAREQIRIEGGRADERDDVAVRRIDRDRRGALTAQRLFGGLLHALIDREEQVVAGDRLLALELRGLVADALDAASLRVDEQLLEPGAAVQLLFVRALDAALAGQRRAGVVVDVRASSCLLR